MLGTQEQRPEPPSGPGPRLDSTCDAPYFTRASQACQLMFLKKASTYFARSVAR